MRKILILTCCILVAWAQIAVAQQKWVERGDIKLWTESFGETKNPPVLLMMGAGASADYWPEPFCKKLSEAGFYVIRYDHRDTGQSTFVDFEKHPYDLNDMTDDALAILDSYGVKKAHLVGFSLGGYIAQIIGIHHPERAQTLALMSTSTDNAPLIAAFKGDSAQSDLPAPDPLLIAKIHKLMNEEPKSASEKVKLLVQFWALINGTGQFDKAYWTQLHTKAVSREKEMKVGENHILAQMRGTADRRAELKGVHIPTLVLQGHDDPFFPPPHAEVTHEILKPSTLVEIPHMGHTLDPSYHSTIVAALIKHWQKS